MADFAEEATDTVARVLAGSTSTRHPERPCLVVMFGGIGCGKSTQAPMVHKQLGLKMGDCVDVNVDNLLECVPGYIALKSDTTKTAEELQALEKPLRNEAKALRPTILTAAIAQRRHIYVEWTAQQNLQKFARGEDEEFPFEKDGYEVVLVYTACPDVPGILKQQATGSLHKRMVPPAIVEEYNRDRSVYFVQAANALRAFTGASTRTPLRLRAMVVMRENCTADGVLTELTSTLPFKYGASSEPVGDGGEKASLELKEEEAMALIRAQITLASGSGSAKACCTIV